MQDDAHRSPGFVSELASRALDALENYKHGSGETVLRSAITQARAAVAAAPTDDPQLPAYLSLLGATLKSAFDRSGRGELIYEAVRIGSWAVELAVGQQREWCLLNQAANLQALYSHDHSPQTLTEALAVAQASTEAAQDPVTRADALTNLALALHHQYERNGDLATLDEAIRAAREAVAGSAPHTGAHHHLNLAVVLLSRFERAGKLATLTEALTCARSATAALPPDAPTAVTYDLLLIEALWRQAKAFGDAHPAEEAVSLCRKWLSRPPAGKPTLLRLLSHTSHAARQLYLLTGERTAATEALEAARQLVSQSVTSDPRRPERLSTLATALLTAFRTMGDPSLLDEAVRSAQEAADAVDEDNIAFPSVQSGLAAALSEAAIATSDPLLAERAAVASQRALAATQPDHPDRPARCANLALHLLGVYRHIRSKATLAEAIELCRVAVAAPTETDSARRVYLGNLAIMLQAHAESTGELASLAEAAGAARDALAITPDGHSSRAQLQSNLAGVLVQLASLDPTVPVLDEARSAASDAVQATPPGHPRRPQRVINLALAHHLTYALTGEAEQLSTALQWAYEAAAEMPARHADRATVLMNLSTMLRVWHARSGAPQYLQAAVSIGREAVSIVGEGHPDQAVHRANLGLTLLDLYQRTGHSALLSEAAAAMEAAAAQTVPDAQQSQYLTNLARAMHALHLRSGRREPLERALEAAHRAVATGRQLAPAYAALNTCLRSWYQLTDIPAVLDEAVEAGRAAVEATGSTEPLRALYLANLAATLRVRIGLDPSARLEALGEARKAVALLSDEHPEAATVMVCLASILTTAPASSPDITEAKDLYARAAANDTASPRTRIQAARGWGRTASGEEAADAYELAVGLIDQLAPRHLPRLDREYGLGDISGLGAEAAAAAIKIERIERAVQLLEQSRGVLLGQMLDARDAERALTPALATRLRRIREDLDETDADLPPEAVASPQNIAERQALLAEWEAARSETRAVRRQNGFTSSPGREALVRAARAGPVVILNAAPQGCDALLLTGNPDEPVHRLQLPFPEQTIIDQANVMLGVIGPAAPTRATYAQYRRRDEVMSAVLSWQWDMVAGPILDWLKLGPAPACTTPPRIWWCPVGAMTFLPWHASGYHGPGDEGRAVLDRAVSSYTSTLRLLQQAQQRSPGSGSSALAIGVPHALGAADLERVPAEIACIRRYLPDTEVLTESAATRDLVLTRLAAHAITHFAGHCESDWRVPSDSQLLLVDHETAPLTVASLARVDLPVGELAFLSACATTQTNLRLADEAIHVTAGFQLAGFRQVIGTLWPIADDVALRVADGFYADITDGGSRSPQLDVAAEALHRAVRRLREERPEAIRRWAGYIHAGP
ncbi:CHAT domain-containing protein [Nonomuraea sp. NPDC050663]|uniref:CHAT domain-containing tetratricopeptide repeat protein n=1 Tax=Nonomuraea sp. NPDC050663 TaxID=3364370 RepID=UPI0037B14166